MAKVSTLVRKLFRKDDKGDRGLQLRLRKAVTLGKVRQVAALLAAGASPVWIEDESHNSQRFQRYGWDPCQLNALLLACRHGDVETLSLLLDACFEAPQVVAHFSRAMYCLVIRHDHWKAFQRLQQRGVPINLVFSRSSTGSSTSLASIQPLFATAMEDTSFKLPMPISWLQSTVVTRSSVTCWIATRMTGPTTRSKDIRFYQWQLLMGTTSASEFCWNER